MVTLNLDDKSGDLSESRVTLGRVVTAAFALAGWLWAWFGGPSSSAVASDYVKLRDSVTTLQAQRAEDVHLRDADQKWKEKVDEKFDRLFELLSKNRDDRR